MRGWEGPRPVKGYSRSAAIVAMRPVHTVLFSSVASAEAACGPHASTSKLACEFAIEDSSNFAVINWPGRVK